MPATPDGLAVTDDGQLVAVQSRTRCRGCRPFRVERAAGFVRQAR